MLQLLVASRTSSSHPGGMVQVLFAKMLHKRYSQMFMRVCCRLNGLFVRLFTMENRQKHHKRKSRCAPATTRFVATRVRGNDPLREHNDPLSPRNDPVCAPATARCVRTTKRCPATARCPAQRPCAPPQRFVALSGRNGRALSSWHLLGRILKLFLAGKARGAVRCPAHSRPPRRTAAPSRWPTEKLRQRGHRSAIPTIQGRCQDAPPKIAGKLFQRNLADSTRLRRVSI